MFDVPRAYEAPTPISRVTNHPQSYLIVSKNWLAVTTHWFGQSLICSGEGCPACEVAWATKTNIYLAAVASGGRETLLELPWSSERMIQVAEENDMVLGHIFTVQREGKSTYRVHITVSDERVQKEIHEREKAEIADKIARIYNLPRRSMYSDTTAWGVAMKDKARQKLSAALQAKMTTESN